MLQARGHKVTGSDQNVYPPMSTQLEALGIEILNGYKAENADIGADCVVVGNAISRGNPELEEILDRKLPLPLTGGDRQRRIHPRPAFVSRRGHSW
jgi:UDP-N-acetylmuramate: L-alanyl-gamma-D-glutamyl-meso-diaminopimelate ligase